MTDKPTRRDLMKPVHLIGIAFGAALFGGLVTAMSMGAFAGGSAEAVATAWRVAAILAGIVFIVVLLTLALLLLVVDPREVAETHDEPLLLRKEREDAEEAAAERTDDEGDAEEDSAR
ncbi:amino acid transporter [Microbacterium sp. gxy059]|uniref:amino acid transporter n=1 Tax=Microbacterium sp. gxy059 TaxID=2957199 RepID=UPI003D97C249